MDRRSFLTTLALIPGLRWLKPAPQSGIVPTEYLGTVNGIDLWQIRDNAVADRIARERLSLFYPPEPERRPYRIQFVVPSRETETP